MADMAKTGEDVKCHVLETRGSIVEQGGEILSIGIRDFDKVLHLLC